MSPKITLHEGEAHKTEGQCSLASEKKKILILGSGFAGLYAAIELEKKLTDSEKVEITLVNRENFFLFTPMLHEVAASDLDLTNIVNPVRKLIRKVRFFVGDVIEIKLAEKKVVVSHGSDKHTHEMPYDHVIIALGSVTNFYGLPGLEERALTMKSLADAVKLRNRIIQHLEEADTECAKEDREELLTFVVAGGGFSGVETISSIHDFAVDALKYYRNLNEKMLRFVLVHPGEVVLPELDVVLGKYAQKIMAKRGIEIIGGTKVAAVTDHQVTLTSGQNLKTRTLLWTAGTSAHPVLQNLPCEKKGGRVLATEELEVPGWPGVWMVGDGALILDPKTGKYYPPTAQHAQREGALVARNILASMFPKTCKRRAFCFNTLGQLATTGRRTGVAKIFGLRFSGFMAWWLWRTIYLMKLPRLEKKIRVAFDWTLDLIFSKDLVRY